MVGFLFYPETDGEAAKFLEGHMPLQKFQWVLFLTAYIIGRWGAARFGAVWRIIAYRNFSKVESDI